MSDVAVNHLEGEFGLINKVKNAMQEAAEQFVYIGFLLLEADNCKYYEEDGFDNIYDFCEHHFGFGRSSTNNFIRVYRQFGSSNGIGLLDSYKPYSYSQLTEMCSMDIKQLNECNPSMSVRELRAVKRGNIAVKVDCVEELETENSVETVPSRQSGQFSLMHLQALEQFLKSRFMHSSPIDFVSPDALSKFVLNQGCVFDCTVYVLGMVKVDLMCFSEHIEIKVNRDKGFVPYYIAYFIYRLLFKSFYKDTCSLKPDLQISDMGKCSNCGSLCSLDDRYCSDCGFKFLNEN